MHIKRFTQISLLPKDTWPILDPDKEDNVMYTLRGIYTLYFYGWSDQWYGEKLFNMTIYRGFRCDGQSSPRIVWPFMRPDGNVRIAALAHDACYRSEGFKYEKKCLLVHDIGKPTLSRLACDQIYRDFYKQSTNGSRVKAQIGYVALRLGGSKYFGKPAPNDKED